MVQFDNDSGTSGVRIVDDKFLPCFVNACNVFLINLREVRAAQESVVPVESKMILRRGAKVSEVEQDWKDKSCTWRVLTCA